MSESNSKSSLRPRFCPQCGAALVTGYDGERERRGCRHCGWIYDPSPIVEVIAVIEHSDGRIVRLHDDQMPLPHDQLRWGEAPDEAAVRVAAMATGLRLSDPRFLGFIQTRDTSDADCFVLTFCYVLQSEGQPPMVAGAELARLREMPQRAGERERYALDAYRAWLDRH
ncbi:MAG: zinc ribbon domain-containing protein [Herpetosiphonaceae bacterium]|nr:zinc ribbon domain-containing protein [Herpetosiphonaceae bacterium]